MVYELMGRAHATIASAAGGARRSAGAAGRRHPAGAAGRRHPAGTAGRRRSAGTGERGQGTVEYVGLVLLMAVLIAGVVKASGGFSDTGIAEAVVKRLKAAIDDVGGGR